MITTPEPSGEPGEAQLVVPPANAVVIVVVGSGRLTALDENGHAVGFPRIIDY
jgi:hypothetical protein